MLIAKQMIIFFILMLIGVIIRKRGIITKENQSSLSSLVVNVGCPAMILSSIDSMTSRLANEELLKTLLIVLITIIVLLIFARLLPMLLRYDKKYWGVVQNMVIITNTVFMGMPFIIGVYGKEAVIYLTFFVVPINLLLFTYGVKIIKIETEPKARKIKDVLNPGMIACIMTIFLYSFSITLPNILLEPLKILGGLTTPLAMLLIGGALLDLKLKEVFTDKRLLVFILIKMILFPIIYLLLFQQFITNTLLLGACFVVVAMPTGNIVAMLSALYNQDTYSLTIKEISLTTAISVITLPLVAFLTKIG